MNTYPILRKKLPDDEWKRLNIFNKTSVINKSLYEATTDIDKSLLSIYEDIFTHTYNNLKVQPSAVFEYILKLCELKNKTLTDGEIKDIDFVENFISTLSDYYMVNGKFCPQIVMNEHQGRVFVHPFFNWKDKWVYSLFKKFNFIDMPHHIMVKFDVNGALLRVLLYLIGAKTNNDGYKRLSAISEDIYSVFIDKILKNEYNVTRTFFKRSIISMMCGSKGEKLLSYNADIIKQIKQHATEFGSDYIFRCTNLFVLKQLTKISKLYNGDFLLPLINVDGGYFLVPDDDKKLELIQTKLKYFNFEKI